MPQVKNSLSGIVADKKFLADRKYCKGCNDWFFNEADKDSILNKKYCKWCIKHKK